MKRSIVAVNSQPPFGARPRVYRKCPICGSTNFVKRFVATRRMHIVASASLGGSASCGGDDVSVAKDFQPHRLKENDLDDSFECESCGMEFDETDIPSLPDENSPEPKCCVCCAKPASGLGKRNGKPVIVCTGCFITENKQ